MSPTTLRLLKQLVDGQRICTGGSGSFGVMSANFHPQYNCPLRFFVQMQAWYREDY